MSNDRQVSAHYGIGEGAIHQYVRERDTAWHAGHFPTNTQSIGIELSADPNRPPDQFTYNASIQLCIELCRKYGLDPRRAIVPHKQFAKTLCPGTVDINYIIDNVARGMSNRTYRPDAATERGPMAAFLYRMSGSPAVTLPVTSPFRDVPTNHVFYREIVWMNQSGISQGWPDGTYRPDAATERGPMAAFLYRMSGSPAVTLPVTSPFRDVPTNHVFYQEIVWMWQSGISQGWIES